MVTQHQGQRVKQLPVEMTTVPPSASLITWMKEPRARTLSGSGRKKAPVNLKEQLSRKSVSSNAGSLVGIPIQIMEPFMNVEEKIALIATILSSYKAAAVSNT